MKRVCLVLFVVGLVAGCGKSSGRGTAPSGVALSAKWNAPAMLGHVPADTPYVIGVIEPIQNELRDQLYAAADQKVAEAVRALEQIPRDFDRSQLEPHIRALFVALDELRGKDLRRWGEELGFHRSGRFVLYGLGVWPVMRLEIADPAKLRTLAKRMLAAAAVTVDEGVLGGRAYWKFTKDKVTFIAAVLDTELVASVLPTSIAMKALPLVLGTEMPKQSLRDTNVLPNVIDKYSLLPAMVGYLDVVATAGIITQRAPSKIRELDAPLLEATGAITQECKADIDRLVTLVPRTVLGYRKLDRTGMHARMIAEMPPAIAREIAKLRVAVPGVVPGRSGSPLGALGIAAKLDEAIPLMRRLTKHVGEVPFRCSWFAGLNAAAAELDARLAQPLPMGIRGVNGLSLVVDSFAKEPLDVRGHVLLVGAGARDITTKLLSALPWTRGITIGADGRPVPVSVAMLGLPQGVTAHVGATGDRAALAVGPTSAALVTEVLARPAPKHSPLVSFAMDVPGWKALGADVDDDSNLQQMRDMVMQLEAIPEGLSIEVFGTFQGL